MKEPRSVVLVQPWPPRFFGGRYTIAEEVQFMTDTRAIVVGAGGISNAWFPPLKAEGVQVVAVVDLRPEAAQAQIDKYELPGAIASGNLEKTLGEAEADFVVDLTIPDAHCEVTCKSLRSGFHVIGEKPMAATLEQARLMVRTAEVSGRLYMVSQSRRWKPTTDTIAMTLSAGRLGTITTLNCDFYIGAHFGGFRDEMDSPLILDMAIHHFDLARMFGGQDAVSVYAEEFNPAGSWYKGDVAADCLFEMTGGAGLPIGAAGVQKGCHTGWDGNWRIIGDRGTLLYAKDAAPVGEAVAGEEGFFRLKAPLEMVPGAIEHREMRGRCGKCFATSAMERGRRPSVTTTSKACRWCWRRSKAPDRANASGFPICDRLSAWNRKSHQPSMPWWQATSAWTSFPIWRAWQACRRS